jgi:Dyp-type peroxidase family
MNTKVRKPSASVDLNKPLDDLSPAPNNALLGSLQANILKGHGRKHTVNVFFEILQTAAARTWMSHLNITSAEQQLEQTRRFKKHGIPGDPVICLGLSAKGLKELKLSTKGFESTFRKGMAASDLGDPDAGKWDFHGAHGWILIAENNTKVLDNLLDEVLDAAADCIRVLRIERGNALFNEAGEGIENFGYVDGRSQPLALRSDIEHETAMGISKFDPTAPLKQVIFADPLRPTAYASYFVFRKLEQNVAGFKAREKELASQLRLRGEDAERAGAMVVGRFEDGTPVVDHDEAMALAPVVNNFNYNGAGSERRCPFHSHIRKANPRMGADSTKRLMFRRGITYGERPDLLPGVNLPFPSSDVGLLFQAYMASIEDQFEFTQKKWVNDDPTGAGKPLVQPGLDPVIGQNPSAPALDWPSGNCAAQDVRFDFRGFTTMRGGEYFYVPSLPAIEAMAK